MLKFKKLILVENQLDGSIDLENKTGTKIIVKFNIVTGLGESGSESDFSHGELP
jgi:hypothetical protein